MITHYSTTELIVGFLGLYTVAAGLGMLGNARMAEAIMTDLEDIAGLCHMSGVFVFAIGAFVVSVQNCGPRLCKSLPRFWAGWLWPRACC